MPSAFQLAFESLHTPGLEKQYPKLHEGQLWIILRHLTEHFIRLITELFIDQRVFNINA